MEDGKLKLRVIKGEREYVLECPKSSSIGELYDVISEMRSFVINKIVEENKGKEIQEEKKQE